MLTAVNGVQVGRSRDGRHSVDDVGDEPRCRFVSAPAALRADAAEFSRRGTCATVHSPCVDSTFDVQGSLTFATRLVRCDTCRWAPWRAAPCGRSLRARRTPISPHPPVKAAGHEARHARHRAWRRTIDAMDRLMAETIDDESLRLDAGHTVVVTDAFDDREELVEAVRRWPGRGSSPALARRGGSRRHRSPSIRRSGYACYARLPRAR